MSNHTMPRAWAEVDLKALRENYRAVRRTVGAEVGIIAMVKANAYGLGVERAVRALEPLEPLAYGVATVPEGVELRRLGVERPVIVFSPVPPGDEREAARAGLEVSISDLEALERWISACAAEGKGAEFHIEIDTGMGRCGFDWRETARWAHAVHARCGSGARWKGVFTHFHGADAPDWSMTRAQWERFQGALAQLPVPREELWVHAANSA